MKKIVFFLAAFCLTKAAFAIHPLKQVSNELKLNVLTTPLMFPEINYERVYADYYGFVVSDYFGYGLSVAYTPLKPDAYSFSIYNTNFQIVSYCRFYFNMPHNFLYYYSLKQPIQLFIEPNVAVVGHKNGISPCVGLALGQKIINIKGYTAEVYVGGGSGLKKDDPVFYWRFGINVGKRF
jgi:hypothetical protein